MSGQPRATVSLRTAALMAAGAVGIFYGGMYAARATPGGEVRNGLSFAGTLTGVSGKQRLIFTFTNKTGVTCAVPSKDTHENGSFVAELPIDACPASLFDGGDVTYTVKVGDDALPGEFNVNPVPYAKYAEHLGSPDCPAGYEVKREAGPPSVIACLRKRADGTVVDEVVKVGEGASAFFIDRYEASIWDSAEGGTQCGVAPGDCATGGFKESGDWTSKRYALSKPGEMPSHYVTWFQAMEACAASGKRLPGRQEWLRAARGTPDPQTGSPCNINPGGPGKAGERPACKSQSGAQDLIGNLLEWTDEWYSGVGKWDPDPVKAEITEAGKQAWGPRFGDGQDATANITSVVNNGGGKQTAVPAAAVRGGAWGYGTSAGVFMLYLDGGPGLVNATVGFRCLLPAR